MAHVNMIGLIHTTEVSELDDLDEGVNQYQSALLLTFDSREELADALESGCVKFKTWREQLEQMKEN